MVTGIIRYEYVMGIRRWGLWLSLFVASAITFVPRLLWKGNWTPDSAWQSAGTFALTANVFLPLVAGILIADRLPRDRHLGVAEILRSTAVTRRAHIVGKYVAAVLAVLTPIVIVWAITAVVSAFREGSTAILLPTALAFLTVTLPTFLFVAAFSVACPAVLPVRVYQVLFTGYWFWGNFLNPKVFPTIAGTVLTASGASVARALFGSRLGSGSVPFALANLLTLAVLATAVLVALERYLASRDHK